MNAGVKLTGNSKYILKVRFSNTMMVVHNSLATLVEELEKQM